jgi:OmpA-OmpF porin, OOP family
MISKPAIAFFALAAAVVAPPVSAQLNMSGVYLGASLGQSKFNDACQGSVPAGFRVSCDDTDTAWKIFGGYQFTPHIAAEIGYTNLGSAQATATGFGIQSTASVEATALDIVAVGSWPVSQAFSLYGKLGVYHGDVSVSGGATGGRALSGGDSGSDVTFGLGARYDFNRNIAARAEWQRYNGFAGSDIDVLSLGVLYRFR